jgi:hypothetical protein
MTRISALEPMHKHVWRHKDISPITRQHLNRLLIVELAVRNFPKLVILKEGGTERIDYRMLKKLLRIKYETWNVKNYRI